MFFSRQDGCQIQGFNSINKDYDYGLGAKTRIGIIGSPVKCDQSIQSRIGFGSAGMFYNMDDSNSCGNELRNSLSIEAFGYIFVHQLNLEYAKVNSCKACCGYIMQQKSYHPEKLLILAELIILLIKEFNLSLKTKIGCTTIIDC